MQVIRREEINPIVKGDPKVIRGWVFYDWANSVYQLTIASAIFPVYYNSVTRTGDHFEVQFFGQPVINTVLYSWSIAAAYLLMAIVSPLLSSVADYTGRRRAFMRFFTWVGALSCGALFFFDRNHLEIGVIAFTLGTIGYGGSIVFYNSFLPVIAPREEQDRISARGYSMGYVGSVILLIINLLVILLPGWFGLPQNSDLPARISFLTVFVWWIGFSHFTFSRLPKYTLRRREKNSGVLMNGYRELMVVSKDVYGSFRLRTFLIGFFFIMMGLLTTMFMAATYGEKELGLDDTVLIPTILVIQLVGVAGARLFAFLSGKTGNLLTMIMAVSGWIFIITGAYFIRDAAGFVLTALVIGLVMGGSQALARSTYSKMLPETRDHTSYFSFYDVMEKMATVAGTFSFGIIEALTGSMRASVLAIGIFFILGLLFLVRLYLRENASFKNI